MYVPTTAKVMKFTLTYRIGFAYLKDRLQEDSFRLHYAKQPQTTTLG
jgi:hypothetical protein